MNELIQQLKSRVGLDDDKAQSAAHTVIDFLKQRLPQPIAGHLDSVLSGTGAAGVENKVESFLGKKSA